VHAFRKSSNNSGAISGKLKVRKMNYAEGIYPYPKTVNCPVCGTESKVFSEGNSNKSAIPGIPAQIRNALVEKADSAVYSSDGVQGMTRIPKCSMHNIEKNLKRWIPNPGASGRRGYGHYKRFCPLCEKEGKT
jgi:hypothetical protein